MSLGAAVRRALGPLEPTVAAAFRALFFDLDDLIRLVRLQVPRAERILEIGAGEGAVAERLVAAYPQARYVGVDVTDRVGRLYRGDRSRATFLSVRAEEYVLGHRGAFDLVVICDVLHHVPAAFRPGLLDAAGAALRPDGALALKEWEDRPNVIHAIVRWFETNVSGETVEYRPAAAWVATAARTFPGPVPEVHRLRPWPNNVAMFFRKGAGNGRDRR